VSETILLSIQCMHKILLVKSYFLNGFHLGAALDRVIMSLGHPNRFTLVRKMKGDAQEYLLYIKSLHIPVGSFPSFDV